MAWWEPIWPLPRLSSHVRGTVRIRPPSTTRQRRRYRPDCLCGTPDTDLGEESTDDATHQRKWAVSASKTLIARVDRTGIVWALESDAFDGFTAPVAEKGAA